ncbi:MAG: hypothetical protein R2828_22135 [Saprospiraceae bacterium]
MQMLKLSFCALLLVLTSCVGSSSKEKEAEADIEATTEAISEDVSNNISSALNKVQDALKDVEKNLNKGEAVEIADFRALKEILPAKMLRMERYSHTGEKTGVTGFKISQATAKYKDDDRRLEISIVDAGGMALASLGAAAWTMVEVDKETDDGYERTTTIDGYKAYEKFDNQRGEAELSIYYKNRFLVSIKGENLKKGDLQDVIDDLDLDELDDL